MTLNEVNSVRVEVLWRNVSNTNWDNKSISRSKEHIDICPGKTIRGSWRGNVTKPWVSLKEKISFNPQESSWIGSSGVDKHDSRASNSRKICSHVVNSYSRKTWSILVQETMHARLWVCVCVCSCSKLSMSREILSKTTWGFSFTPPDLPLYVSRTLKLINLDLYGWN